MVGMSARLPHACSAHGAGSVRQSRHVGKHRQLGPRLPGETAAHGLGLLRAAMDHGGGKRCTACASFRAQEPASLCSSSVERGSPMRPPPLADPCPIVPTRLVCRIPSPLLRGLGVCACGPQPTPWEASSCTCGPVRRWPTVAPGGAPGSPQQPAAHPRELWVATSAVCHRATPGNRDAAGSRASLPQLRLAGQHATPPA